MKQLNGESLTATIPAPVSVPWTPTLEDVRIRPYGAGDRERLRRLSGRLSKASLYTRFFSGTPCLPEHFVRSMDHLDHWDREAMVALLGGEIIGIAEYIRDARRPGRAEIAVLVADLWQRLGLGSVLIADLAGLAERRGIHEFDADVVLENRGALDAVRRSWPAARAAVAGGAARFRLPLPIPV
ncbi:GNAT family N-acetyltransferase [Spirillospora albida]|uniref:GNAT family N-acetyltransferase n=1 Tax=Spirillospora albida TaxID=58123 RepID=UPI0009FEDC6F|nr:GNAT family N-acetyltransferase [Spirillospora albida]